MQLNEATTEQTGNTKRGVHENTHTYYKKTYGEQYGKHTGNRRMNDEK